MRGFNPLRMDIARQENQGDWSIGYLDDILCNVQQVKASAYADMIWSLSIKQPPYVECMEAYTLRWGGRTDKVLIIETRLNPSGKMEVACEEIPTIETLRKRSALFLKEAEGKGSYYDECNK